MKAKKMIENGEINAAIIGTSSVCINPSISLQLEGLGRLNKTLETRSFSADGTLKNQDLFFFTYINAKTIKIYFLSKWNEPR